MSTKDGSGPTAPLRVLIVEDHPDTADIIARVLRGRGDDVVVAQRLDEARPLLDARRFDLALIDIGLPDGSGAEVIPLLRVRSPHARAVAMTGHCMPHELAALPAAGFDAQLLKPVELDRLAAEAEVAAHAAATQAAAAAAPVDPGAPPPPQAA